MPGLSKQQALADLRTRIEGIEKRPLLAEGPVVLEAHPGLMKLPSGLLQEVFADAHRDAGAALGFALGLAKTLLTAERPAILVLQLSRDSQDLGVPYGLGLRSFGLDPDSVVIGQMDNPVDLLWAMEEAIACRAVAAVIADIGTAMKALDFTASRRLSLRAAAAGSSAFLIRYSTEREASAARLRWRVMPASSAAPAFDARAPGAPRWRVQLEKGKLGSKREASAWMLDWTENGVVLAEPSNASGTGAAAGTALSGAHPAALGDRLSQTG